MLKVKFFQFFIIRSHRVWLSLLTGMTSGLQRCAIRLCSEILAANMKSGCFYGQYLARFVFCANVAKWEIGIAEFRLVQILKNTN